MENIDKTYIILKHGYCTGNHCGGKNIAEEDHSCPYAEEINGDYLSECNCCSDCQLECANDI